MKKHFHKLKSYIKAHKVISAIILIIFLLSGYYAYVKFTSTAGDTRYIISKVEKGIIIASVSGSGQVSALNQIDIKSKVSGDVIYLSGHNGQRVGTGALIAQLDTRDTEKSVRDAETNLESAKISLDKIKIQKSNENMKADLAQAYDDGFNSISNTFLDLPVIITGLNDMFFKNNSGTGQSNIDWYDGQAAITDREQTLLLKRNFNDSYTTARTAYDKNFEDYKGASRAGSSESTETLIAKTYDTTRLISDAVKSANNYLDFINDSLGRQDRNTPAILSTHKTNLSTYTSETNGHLLNLLAIKTSIKSYKDAFPNADLDTQSAELSLKQKENALQDAKDKLSDYFIHAPFAGTIAKINIKKLDSVNAGAVIATLITQKQLAEISLNEVDVAKIKIGQKTTLTFDAIPNLIISGIVAEIDSIGTISQGVVTYLVKVSFDTQDERIKPAMSVSAAIVTDVKQDVLMVPNSAVKSRNGKNYVEMFAAPLPAPTDELLGSISKTSPNKITVERGFSNDAKTEIISGLNEGDEIVTRTIAPSTATTTTAAPSIFGSPARGGGGGGVRRAD